MDLSFLKRVLLGELPRRLSERGWLWYLPLLLAVMPLWQAWHLTGLVPRADHWNVIVEPYLKTVDGGPLWDFFHSPGTDSRHDAAKLLHYLVIEGTGWNLFAESMVCVVLGVLATMLALQFWKRHPGPVMTRGMGACLGRGMELVEKALGVAPESRPSMDSGFALRSRKRAGHHGGTGGETGFPDFSVSLSEFYDLVLGRTAGSAHRL